MDKSATFVPHKQGDRYNTEEERNMGRMLAQRNSSARIWNCEVCNETMRIGSRTNHKKSNKHLRNLDK